MKMVILALTLYRRHHNSSIRTWQDAVALMAGAAVYIGMRMLLAKRALVRAERMQNVLSFIAAIIVMTLALVVLK